MVHQRRTVVKQQRYVRVDAEDLRFGRRREEPHDPRIDAPETDFTQIPRLLFVDLVLERVTQRFY